MSSMFGFIPNLGVTELFLILGIALIVIGPGKLPEAGKALGKSISEFKRARSEREEDLKDIEAREEENK